MRTTTDPEREVVRKATPFAIPAFALALVAGSAIGGWDAGWSAAIGVAIVFANFVVHALSLARAAKVSLTVLYAVGLGGFVVRLAVIVAVMAGLNQLAFFSPIAFAAAVVPTTLLLLAYEMKLLAGPIGQMWQTPRSE